MKVMIKKGVAQGTAYAPPSKSYAHRELISAALADGESHVRGVSYSEDILATLECLESLGVRYEKSGADITVYGCGGRIKPLSPCNCRESGSTLRFLIPVALLSGDGAVFSGTERLIARGVGVYKDLLAERGITFETGKTEHKIEGQLVSGEYKIPGNVSSQFVSGMLFALPLLSGDSTLEIIPPVESRSYIDITIDVLARFGIEIEETAQNVFYIRGSQKYMPTDITVEGDWSNAAFLYALSSIGGDVRVENVREDSLQGDKVCLEHLDRLSRPGAEIDLSDCPDLAPVLFAVSAAKYGAIFTGTKRLAIKESDRASVMAEELSKFGTAVTVSENSVCVSPRSFHAPNGVLSGHNDHRIVMALSVIGTLTSAEIDGAEAIKKSYPDFFDVIRTLGTEVDFVSD